MELFQVPTRLLTFWGLYAGVDQGKRKPGGTGRAGSRFDDA